MLRRASCFLAAFLVAGPAVGQELCQGFGPQTPRDIASAAGANPRSFAPAPAAEAMNLCNIHTHTNAEHKGPGFSVSAGEGEHGGWRCNETFNLTVDEIAPAPGAMTAVKPGDTIEVHWVFTSCHAAPGEGLGSCATEACVNPQLRVESQVFLVVNSREAADFHDFGYEAPEGDGRHQPRSLPASSEPVVFAGSTTGPKYDQATCSPYQVTWSVRPACMKLDIQSLHAWAEHNVFNEHHSHGVRQIVTAPELLSPIAAAR